ncbi:MAG: 30S ribosomal protein S2 [Candidatus Berkelbacteria bacterium]|nr:30S ribosomal protein S2 [Candidatus Berkelbacteria bacterium]
MVKAPTFRGMLDVCVHFGHKTSRWHPKMAPYIFTSKSGVHVINLEMTASLLDSALNFIRNEAAAGKSFVFVGTKKQSGAIVKEAATAAGVSYVNIRWLGGTITNFDAIRGAVKKYKQQLEELELSAAGKSALTKAELSKVRKEVARGEKFLGGLVNLDRKPDVLVLFGSHDEKNALAEAKVAGIPVVALVDTNTNPTVVEYPIPANDDATKSVTLFANLFADVIKEAREKSAKVEK